jgi:hypothetical protein
MDKIYRSFWIFDFAHISTRLMSSRSTWGPMNPTLNTNFLTDSTVPVFLLHLSENVNIATAVRRFQ